MEKYNKPWIWISVIVLVMALFTIGTYNRLVGLNQQVSQSWAQVENQLQRRNDLIPNLVSTVKGYAKHEKAVFTDVAESRTRLAGAISKGTQAEKIEAAKGMNTALGRLLAIAESYPALKASENFRALQDQLEGTENRISVERMRYNQSVQAYNTTAMRFPTMFFVRWFGFDGAKPYFEAPENAKKVPKVEF